MAKKPTYEELQQRVKRLEREVSDCNRAAEELRQQQSIFIGGPVVIFRWLATENWPVAYVSPNVSQFGYQADDFLSGRLPYTNIIHREDLDKVLSQVKEHCELGVPFYEQEYRIIQAAGETRWVYDFTLVRRNDQNEITHYDGYLLDITERKRAEERLKESEERYRTLFEGAAEGVIVADIETMKFKYVNPAICRMLGYSEEELVRMGVDGIHPKEALGLAISEFKAQAQGDKTLARDIPCLRKDGTTIYANINTAKILIDGRRCNVGFFTDITEHKWAEEAFKETEEFNSSLLTNSPNPIIVINPDTSVKYVNPALEKLTGFSSEELVGYKAPYPWWTEETLRKTSGDLKEAMLSGAQRVQELFQKKNGKRFWVEISSTPVTSNGTLKYYLATWFDTTDRKEVEHALEQRTHHLGKRVRELTCLYAISHLIAKPGITLGEILQGTLNLISCSWQYPEITCARINLEGQHFKTHNFAETIWKQAADITVGGDRIGTLEVFYLEQKPEEEDGPFLKEEKSLLKVIVETLGKTVTRIRTEEALRLERDNLVNILNSMKDGVYIADQQYTVQYANPAFRNEFCFGEGEKCHEYFHGRKDPCPSCKNHEILSGSSTHWETYFPKTRKTYDIVATPLKRPDGSTSKLSIVRDITGSKRVQEELKQTTEQLSVLMESLPIVLYSCNPSGNFAITYISDSVERITGYSPRQFTEDAAFWAAHIHPDDQVRGLGELPSQLMRDKHQVEYRFRIVDGSYRWFVDTWRVVRLRDGTISHVVGIWQDVTQEKKIAQQAEYRLQQIIQTDRLASLGKVVAGVAHEINNPNSFITYNIPLLEETWQLFEPLLTDYVASHPEWRKSNMTIDELCQDMREIIQAIKVGSKRINKVVANLKDFARLDESACAKPVQVNKVVEKTLSIVGSQVSKHVKRSELNLAGNLPEIQGQAQKLEQVVANLVVNAVYAIPNKETGRLSITTRYIERLKSVLIEVEDNGTGMKPSVLKRIFEPFFTTRRDVGGTGLGLSVSYGLIQEHNGTIGVLSRPGLGSRFTVFLPLDPDTKLDIHPSIFCVDDDVGFLSEVKMFFLDVKDMSFETSSNPDSVMRYLEEHPEVDIVLADIMMPGINGWKLLEKIKARFPLLRVILYSGYPNALKQKPYGSPGPDHLLKKPFTMEQLLELINVMGRQRL